MKSFKEIAVNELKIDGKSFEKFSSEAIKNINLMIEYGRNVAELDNKQLNSLLDSIKNIHSGGDSIRNAPKEKTPEKIEKIEKKDGKKW